jgi:hypothetical protein
MASCNLFPAARRQFDLKDCRTASSLSSTRDERSGLLTHIAATARRLRVQVSGRMLWIDPNLSSDLFRAIFSLRQEIPKLGGFPVWVRIAVANNLNHAKPPKSERDFVCRLVA